MDKLLRLIRLRRIDPHFHGDVDKVDKGDPIPLSTFLTYSICHRRINLTRKPHKTMRKTTDSSEDFLIK